VQEVVTLRTDNGEVKVRLVTSYWASRIKVWTHPGQHLDKGQRIGRILLGSTVIVELPGKVALAVKKDERVVAGETLITTGGKTQ
jgi:phosphatidylserine decarboxylase